MSFKENKWNICFIGDVADILNGYAFKAKDFQCKGVPIIKIKNIVPPNISIEDVQYVSRDLYNEKIKYALKYNDILISMTGSGINQISSAVGKIGRVRIKDESLLLNQRVGKLFVKDKNKCDEDYLYYYMTQNSIRYDLASSAGGSANQANISPAQIKSIKIILPPLEEQKAIAKILSDLDEKIEVNNKINKNLEEMAQAIFKQWFVDFEFPNEEGKPYKSSGGEMVKSELGMIPKGWEKCTLDKVANVSAGGDKPKKFSKIACDEYTVPIYSNGIDREGLYGYTDKAKILEESVTVSARGTIGYVCLRHQPYVPIVRLISVTPNTKLVSAKYLYFLLKRTNIIGTGTTQQQLTVPDFKKTKMYVPQYEYMKKFTIIVNSWFERINNNNIENERLEKLRDTLLPKLMSGEIRVPLENNEN
ncbi:restriction endonuclease subunit S [Clostridium perfringens]|uniref:restriction endonuclease subunit S n=1 Tax=Clostridium perfringens TaxID=1502 RepID=UPI001A3359E6|nr:restriction endonuclease subunit S [Clostridium perfringens]MDH5077393.1 putative type-1 restriction enzyme specificity protein MPN089 [Clostridium perfringens]MDM0457014.1 restriction endonuclease subunit S [Clostridium perfringens]UYC94258.1 restriction endonuclease subunit S [Clostridium perfringens]HAT4156335.1 restriction endonuclease subunit S [Clostridium perfringens]